MSKCNAILQHLYHGSEDQSSKQGGAGSGTFIDSVVADYRAFSMEKKLGFADRVSSSRPANCIETLSETLNFVTCQSLAMVDCKKEIKNANKSECSFEISDTELLNCCDQVDEMLTGVSQRRLFLVNSILEDFSLSPITTKHEAAAHFWEYSPEFVLKTKPSKTYSCRRQIDCSKRLDFNSNDGNTSNSSSISIEENLSQMDDTFNTTVMADTSKRLCENLLNLSAYYSQKQCIVNNAEPKDFSFLQTKVDLLQLKCNSRHHRCSSYSSSEDFYGFPDHSRDVDNELQLRLNQSCIPNVGRELAMGNEGTSGGKSSEGHGSMTNHYIDEWNDDFEDVIALIKTPPHKVKTFVSPTHISEDPNLKIRNSHDSNVEMANRESTFKAKGSEIQILCDLPSTSKAAMTAKRVFEDIRNCDSESTVLQPYKVRIIEASVGVNELKGGIINDLDVDEMIRQNKLNNSVISDKGKPWVENIVTEFSADYQNIGYDLKLLRNSKPAAVCGDILHPSAERKESLNHTFEKWDNTDDVLPLPISNQNLGFKTANGKKIAPSAKALKSVESLLKEIQKDSENSDKMDLVAEKTKMHQKRLKQIKSGAKRINEQKLWSEDMDSNSAILRKYPSGERPDISNSVSENDVNNTIPPLAVFNKNVEFRTASGKNISASVQALKKVERLFEEIPIESEQGCENELERIKKSAIHQKKIKRATSKAEVSNEFWSEDVDLENAIIRQWPSEEQLRILRATTENEANEKSSPAKTQYNIPQQSLAVFNKNVGFHTANGKKIKTSAKALKSVEILFKQFQTEFEQNGENSLEAMKNKINQEKSRQPTSQVKSINEIKSCKQDADLDKVIDNSSSKIENGKNNEIEAIGVRVSADTEVKGFQIAGGKKVTISENAKNMAESLLHNLQNDYRTSEYENELSEIRNSMQKKSTKHIKGNTLLNLQNVADVNSIQRNPDLNNEKRSPQKCQNYAKCSLTELSVRSPLNTSATNSIISRKNLLSLSKKRKKNTSMTPSRETSEVALNANLMDHSSKPSETPIKTDTFKHHISQVAQSPSTPNMNEFFYNASKCSTPRSELNVTIPREIDKDLQPILWEPDNKPTSKLINANKTTDDACSNITINSSHSSVNERITRLRMYGEAPPVSPLPVKLQKNCRFSGLRRTRSMIKKCENN